MKISESGHVKPAHYSCQLRYEKETAFGLFCEEILQFELLYKFYLDPLLDVSFESILKCFGASAYAAEL